MNDIRVFLCDDEPLAIGRLAGLLARIEGVAVVGSAPTGTDAVAAIERDRPDLVLLDVEMPDIDGFDVVEELARRPRPAAVPLVAFVTAFRRFAPQAFDSGAIDFLSKPVRLTRLETTIERARTAMAAREAQRRMVDLQAALDALRADPEPPRDAHVWVQRRGEMVRVALDKVDRVAAEGAYVRLHLDATSFLHREPIGSIEARLDPARFIRIHRSHVVRVDRVGSIRRTLHGASELALLDGTRLPLGRKFAKAARAMLLDREGAGVGPS